MIAAFSEQNKLAIKDIPIFTVTKGDILVKNHISGINFADTIQVNEGLYIPPSGVVGCER